MFQPVHELLGHSPLANLQKIKQLDECQGMQAEELLGRPYTVNLHTTSNQCQAKPVDELLDLTHPPTSTDHSKLCQKNPVEHLTSLSGDANQHRTGSCATQAPLREISVLPP